MVGLIDFPRRTTIVRLGDGTLWVHNVNALDRPGVRKAVDALGPVRHIVAPNKFHHFWVGRWKSDYPEATVYAARGLAKKKPDLPLDHTLGEAPPESWGGELDMLQTEGHPALNEVVFYHRPSRTLILTDWVFNVGSHEPLLTRWLFRLNGCYCRLRPSRLFRSLAKDREAIRRTTEAICDRWDFGRVVMAHGMVTDAGPRELRAAFADF
jgi:hypothetical protein